MMKPLFRFFILGAIAGLLAGCKSPTETQLNGSSAVPGFLYAGTYDDGVFRSIDEGITWIKVDKGLTSDSINALASDDSFLFAGSWGKGVFRSSDNAQSWIQVIDGLSSALETYSLITIGKSIIVTCFKNFSTSDGGVFLSKDEGENWTETDFSGSDMREMASIGQFIFAADGNDALCRSTDSGVSWKVVKNVTSRVLSFSTDGQSFFFGTYDDLYRSDDSGVNWLSLDFQNGVSAIFGNENYLLVGAFDGNIFRSTDRGNSWARTFQSNSSVVTEFMGYENRIYAGLSANGVFVSTDNGLTWVPDNKGMESENVVSLAVH